MRATIRQTNLTSLHADVDAAMTLVDIDDSATYRRVTVINSPGQPPTRTEQDMPGHEVRATLRVQLLTSMHEVEQNDPLTIEARWTRKSKRNGYRTHACTYSRVPAPSRDRPATPPVATPTAGLEGDLPSRVTTIASDIELVAEAGEPQDAIDLSRQLVRDGHTQWAIDVRRTVTRGALDRNALRKLSALVARQMVEEYRDACKLQAAGLIDAWRSLAKQTHPRP